MKRTVFSTIFLILLLAALCLSLPVQASGPDPDRTGSIRVELRTEDGPVVGGSLTLHLAGEPALQDGQWQFVPTPAFAGISLADPSDPALPGQLLARARDLPGVTVKADGAGVVFFPGLKPGLYLISQQTAAPGFLPISPFLVTVPVRQGDDWVYAVDASPKTEPEPSAPTEPDLPHIPQTGQLTWPVPVLAFGGVLLFLTGWLLFFKKGEGHET